MNWRLPGDQQKIPRKTSFSERKTKNTELETPLLLLLKYMIYLYYYYTIRTYDMSPDIQTRAQGYIKT